MLTDKMQGLGLSSAAAVNHPMNVIPVIIQHLPDHGSISPGRGEKQLSDCYALELRGVSQAFTSGINKIHWDPGIEAFGKQAGILI